MRTLLLFAKRPAPGRVKTRLAAAVGPEPACALYRAFLADELARLARFATRARVELRAEGPGAFDDPPPPAAARVVEQGPGDLGARLARAFDAAFAAGDAPVVALGADAPTLPDATVDAAFAALEEPGAGLCVAPARDGGYVLVGLARRCAALFRDVPWGGPRVLATTLERARAAGLAARLLPPGDDVDDVEGLARLAAALADPATRARAPRTAERLDALRAAGALPSLDLPG